MRPTPNPLTTAASIIHIVEYRAKNRRGQWVWLQCRGIRLCDASGEPALFAGYISDMGRRNKVDQQTGV